MTTKQQCLRKFRALLRNRVSTAVKFECTKANGRNLFVLMANGTNIFSYFHNTKAELIELWRDMNMYDRMDQFPIMTCDSCLVKDIIDSFPRIEVLLCHA